ncbi:MAG: KpsF/GutQ family sugar-phosphate isomerase [Magnetospiraceae bacterium]
MTDADKKLDRAANPDIDSARRVLNAEAEGLAALAAGLDASFITALDLIDGVAGRVVVTGMGKSGHVARKIAATLASTGTPAFFVHPGEASHGDLGMITRADALIALSNSGKTPELSDVVAHAKRIAIPLITITGKAGSPLAEAADVALVLPTMGEACPLGLAPTTSTTATMALGDALAVALLERKNFSSADFRALHPGGQLGRRLLKVADLMHAGDELPLVPLETSMADTLLVMTAKRFGCVGITDAAGRLEGIITDGDLRRHMGNSLLEIPAGDVMTRHPTTIGPNALASEALGIMNDKSITVLMVLTPEGRPIGILHIHDCLRAGIA